MPSSSSLATFAAMAMAIALCWLLVSATASGASAVIGRRRAARLGLRRAPAAFLVLELDGVDGRVRRLASAIVVFAVGVGLLAAFGRDDLAPALPAWQRWAVAALVPVAAGYGIVRLAQLSAYRRRLRALIEANASVAERLGEVQLRGHRVFHAVPVGRHVIDHVVVGPIGVFALQVVVPGRPGATGVRLARGALHFAPAHGSFRLAPVTEAFAVLARELGRAVGHPVKVVPTLVAPGCGVEAQDDERYLVSNEQNCVALVGWKDCAAYLMDDEIARISEWLAGRCRP